MNYSFYSGHIALRIKSGCNENAFHVLLFQRFCNKLPFDNYQKFQISKEQIKEVVKHSIYSTIQLPSAIKILYVLSSKYRIYLYHTRTLHVNCLFLCVASVCIISKSVYHQKNSLNWIICKVMIKLIKHFVFRITSNTQPCYRFIKDL